MATVNLTLPKITMEELEDDKKLQKILSYLYQLNEQMRYELTHIDDDNISGEGISESSLTDSVARTLTNDQGEVMQLYMSARKMLLELSAKTEATSEGLTTVSERVGKIEVNADRLETEFSYLQKAQDETDANVTSISERVSSVEQTAESITQTVSAIETRQDDTNENIESLEERITTVEQTADGLSIEVSKKVTQEDVDESIDAIDEFHNTAVDIAADGITMNTTGSIRALVNDIEQLTIDSDGVSAKYVVADEIHAQNIVEKHSTSTVEWKGGIQASIDALPKYLTQDTTLTIPVGTYLENVVISGFVGAKLTIKLSEGVNINGTLRIRYCDAIAVSATSRGDASIYPQSNGLTIGVFACQHLWLTNLQISGYRGRTTASNGSTNVLSIEDSNARVHGCCIEYAGSGAAYVHRGGTFDCAVCIGGCDGSDPTTNANLGYGVQATLGTHGVLRTSVPMSVKGNIATNATLLNSSTAGAAGGMEYTEPEYVTKSFAISKHCTYLYGVSRVRDDQSTLLSQGRYGTYSSGTNNWRIGAMWFADAVTALSGKTIKSAKLTIRRGSGGWSNAVSVYLGTVSVVEASFALTLTPAFTAASTYPIASLARETEATYDVTNLMTLVQAGHALGVFEPVSEYSGSFSPAYTTFYGKGSGYEPILTVEYK